MTTLTKEDQELEAKRLEETKELIRLLRAEFRLFDNTNPPLEAVGSLACRMWDQDIDFGEVGITAAVIGFRVGVEQHAVWLKAQKVKP